MKWVACRIEISVPSFHGIRIHNFITLMQEGNLRIFYIWHILLALKPKKLAFYNSVVAIRSRGFEMICSFHTLKRQKITSNGSRLFCIYINFQMQSRRHARIVENMLAIYAYPKMDRNATIFTKFPGFTFQKLYICIALNICVCVSVSVYSFS